MVSSKLSIVHTLFQGLTHVLGKDQTVNVLGFAGCMMVCVTPVSSALVAQKWSDTRCKETALLCSNKSLFAKTGTVPFDLQVEFA